MKKTYLSILTFVLPFFLIAQNTDSLMLDSVLKIDEVVVKATRATETTPTTFTKVSQETIAPINNGQDLPYLLQGTPSLISTSDAGAGVGYTALRLRGSDLSRINLTINGIPYNDPESQGVFLVNLPDFASSINNIQIQRGVGTSTNGAGAFGGTINMLTNKKNQKAYAHLSNSLGSFATQKHTLNFGTGAIKNKFSVDGRLSRVKSNGYVDRASSDLWSYYISAAYYGKQAVLRFNHFSGRERTYQAWNGVDAETLETNRTFNISGTDYGDIPVEEAYENEVDNYKQDHYQLFLTNTFKDHFTSNFALHYTRGKGYFENLKIGSDLVDYQLDNIVIGNDTITETDLVTRRWLDNHFYGAVYSLNYKDKKFDATIGTAWNQYDGDHFGNVIWAKQLGNANFNHQYYFGNGLKTDFNIYAKVNYNPIEKLTLFADLQYRRVSYSTDGIDNDLLTYFHDVDYNFFNPKFGLSYQINNKQRVYGSFAMAGREPVRNDFLDNPNQPKAEFLRNLELGYNLKGKKGYLNTVYYLMHYKDQLINTGQLNDVGSLVRKNAEKSYRTGIEVDGGILATNWLDIRGNVTWSLNEVKAYEETDFTGETTIHDNTKIAFSPMWQGNANLSFYPLSKKSKLNRDLTLAIVNQYVGKQYLDNTTNENRTLDAYFVNHFNASYTMRTKIVKKILLKLQINNFTNRLYEANGYVYYGQPYYFPQAGAHFLVGLDLKF